MPDSTAERVLGTLGIEAASLGADDAYVRAVLTGERVTSFEAEIGAPSVFSAPIGGATMPLSEMKARLDEAAADEQHELAGRFATRVRELHPRAAVWADYGQPYVVTVVTADELDLDDELALHALFVDLARNSDSNADLMLRSAAEIADRDLDLGQRVA